MSFEKQGARMQVIAEIERAWRSVGRRIHRDQDVGGHGCHGCRVIERVCTLYVLIRGSE